LIWFRLIAVAAVLLAITLAYHHYTGLLETISKQRETIATQSIALDMKTAEIASQKAAMAQMTAATEKVQASMAKEREKVTYVRQLFGDHDFANLAEKKPGLISKKMQAATAKVFSEIEAASR